MELQWPLILFTTLVAWSAGLFGAQGVMALRGAGRRSQMPALATSVVLLAVGGVSVFFHLQHWERIFNGFGHITSGITQELIAIVVVFALMVAYFVCLRKSEDGGGVPRWLAAVSIVACVALVVVMAHSYTMAARPAWDSVLWIFAVLGEACLLGPATMAVVMALRDDDVAPVGLPAVAGAAVNAVTTIAFAIFLQTSGSAFTEVGYYFDPTHPTMSMVDVAGTVSSQAPLLWVGAVVVGAIVPLAAVLVARRRGEAAGWKLWGGVAIVAAVAGALCLRVVFYELGFSVFMFY